MIKFYNDDYRTPRERDVSAGATRSVSRSATRNDGRSSTRQTTRSEIPVQETLLNCRGEVQTNTNPGIAVPRSCNGTPSLAAMYAPYQSFSGLYEIPEALRNGTLFAPLNKPFTGGGGVC